METKRSPLKQYEPYSGDLTPFCWDAAALKASLGLWQVSVPDKVLDEFQAQTKKWEITPKFIASCQKPDLNLNLMAAWLKPLRPILFDGLGLLHIRGLAERVTDEAQMQLFYLAVGLYLVGPTIERYDRLFPIYNRGGLSYKDEAVPVSMTGYVTNFHTDSTAAQCHPDVIALLCLQPALEGGENQFVSAARIHQIIAEKRPDLLRALYKESIRDVITPGDPKTVEAILNNRFPVFSSGLYNHKITLRYMRFWIERGHKKSGVAIDPKLLEAMDYLDSLLHDPVAIFTSKLGKGEMVFVNNHTVAHNRTEYTESEDPSKKRKLVRMWLSNEEKHSVTT